MSDLDPDHIRRVLTEAVEQARTRSGGAPASYIPDLALVDPERTSAAVTLLDGTRVLAGDAATHRFTLQSSAKLALLAGLLEERGDAIFEVVGSEPSGGSFASVAWLEMHGPKPPNPLVNSGAIALSALLRGNLEDRLGWIERWVERLYGRNLTVNQRVLASERRTGHRNRAIAWFLRGAGLIEGPIDDVLETYFSLCALEGKVEDASWFAAILAGGGVAPDGRRILSPDTAAGVVALMATCGMYDESGAHLLACGMPAKSGVSGVIVAVATGRAGIAVSSPRINALGGSVRGHAILRHVSRALGWHFALGRPQVPGDAHTPRAATPRVHTPADG